jgi:DNA topoisomerase-1
MSSLVIVESPAKARTINKILGKGYTVKASVGHVMDLPPKKIGVDVENDFRPDYEVIKGKEKVIKELKAAARSADRIYLAPDPDREGEAIAYHIASVVGDGKNADKIFRVTFNEITPKAVREAIENPGKLDTDKVDAQQARRILDRLVGYNLSPLLWKKIRRGLSAGRVQSVAVRLVVEREREVEAFNKEEYWSLPVRFEGPKPPPFAAKLFRVGDRLVVNRDGKEGERFLITGEAEAERITAEIRTASFVLDTIENKKRKRSPAPPFTTSTLQQESSRKLGYTAKRTMALAQQLYEGVELGSEGSVGLITYMRTDSVRIATEAQEGAREFIKKTFGGDYVPQKPPVYKSKASAQEAHEAVRPTGFHRTPESVSAFLSPEQLKLYRLVWNRFMASQMKPAEVEQTTMDVAATPKGASAPTMTVRATGTVVKFPGFMALYTEVLEGDASDDDEDGILPALKTGDKVKLLEATPKQHFTQPPPRFTEASLVKTLEERGIGRPSTYAAIMSTIVDREYVEKEQGKFKPTELGAVVNDYLVDKFPELLDIDFTAKMETKLDRIEAGKNQWVRVVREFFKPFSKDLTNATEETGKVKPKDIETEQKCDKCGADMVIRWGRHGRFMACSGYPECKNTMPLEGEEQKPRIPDEPTDEKCPKCSSPMVIKSGRFGKFMACTNYPTCKSTKPISMGVQCPEDGGDIVEKRTRKGKSFWSCANYPKCKFATWHRPLAEVCPECKAPYLVIKKEKSGGVVKACENKECGFKAPYEEAKQEG